MNLTATQFKNNFGEYLAMAASEDIFVTKNNKIVAKVSNPFPNKMQVAESLFGVLPNEYTLEDSKAERLSKI